MSVSHEMPAHLRGYVVNQMATNYWRVESSLSRAEVIQEAYCVYLKVAQRYPDVEPKHLTALFKTAWSNHFTDLTKKDSHHRQAVSLNAESGADFDILGDAENLGYLRTMVRQAPSEVRQVLALLLNAPQELVEMALEGWSRGGRRRADSNARVAAWLGLPASSKPLDAVREYFAD